MVYHRFLYTHGSNKGVRDVERNRMQMKIWSSNTNRVVALGLLSSHIWVQQQVVPDVTVLKASHHGSSNGFTREFLERAEPEVVVISVGANRYGHPHSEAVQAYEAVSQTLLTTREHGPVTILGYADGRYEIRW